MRHATSAAAAASFAVERSRAAVVRGPQNHAARERGRVLSHRQREAATMRSRLLALVTYQPQGAEQLRAALRACNADVSRSRLHAALGELVARRTVIRVSHFAGHRSGYMLPTQRLAGVDIVSSWTIGGLS